MNSKDRCVICGCAIHRYGDYAKPTVKGRSHATKHHLVAERFFGRTSNRKGQKRKGIFSKCPWNAEGKTVAFCYECHEELLHNPVFLQEDLDAMKELVKKRNLNEFDKSEDKNKIAGRIELLHEIIAIGLKELMKK